ncbi:transcriptional regulator, AraC family [Hydrocarboniphaga daqingensis]|uniref:Transcriptional regulator, AraC family n=1 Tax=Hydrocarboniphaga daqingensis TaxID=490188 RepID=A0A1M5PRR5_9GAMM|nr:AraC family transcriptional regulator [Hydrocarboniphaga daqingensis]SHH04567.1 transcriptional regulator, AraC family [Hydrocarboniphaga daqingensis]
MISLNRPSVSAIYPLAMLQLAVERGVPAERVLRNAGLSLEQLQLPSARITPRQQAIISYNLLTETADPAVGLELGLRANVTKTGLMGFGLMSCATFREVSDLGIRYLQTRVPYFTLSRSVEGPLAIVQAREVVPLGPLHQFGFDHFMAEVYEICRAFANPQGSAEAHALTEIWLDSAEQPYYARYAERLPRLRFGMPSNQFRFSAALLDVPIATVNPVTAQMAFEQCEREMALLGYTQSLPDRIRALLVCTGGHYPDLVAAAASLHLSTRTLKRRLAEQNTSFGDLLDEVRKRDSLQWLVESERSIDDIAQRVGYADPSNFRRAFQRWTGLSPSAYRERQRSRR